MRQSRGVESEDTVYEFIIFAPTSKIKSVTTFEI